MRTRLPGDYLHRVLAWCVDPQTFADIVEPAIGDLQFESQRTKGSAWRRWTVRVRGYWAVGHAVIGGGLNPTPAFARVLALVGLSIAGAMLMTCARLATTIDSRPFIGAFLVPMFLTPIVLSRTGLGASYTRLFAGCAAVAFMTQGMDLAFYDLRAVLVYHRQLEFQLSDLVVFVGALAIFSAVVAASAWRPATGVDPLPRRLVIGLFFGGLTAASAFGAAAALRHDASPLVAAARVPFYAAMFGVLLVVTAIPLVMARRWMRIGPALAAMGVVLSPAAIVAQSYVEHETAATCLDHFTQAPIAFAALHLPIIAGAAVLGWCLAPTPQLARGEPTC